MARRSAAFGLLVLLGWGAAACGSRTGLTAPALEMDAGAPNEDPAAPVCIEVRPHAGPVTAQLTIPAALAVVDVLFVVDATGSMADEIGEVRRRLRQRLVPAIRARIADAAFGLALFGEFPVRPHGEGSVQPYALRTTMTRRIPEIEAALELLPSWGNLDEPEAQVEALYQVATGEGLSGWIPPLAGCPRGGWGGACFRDAALPVVLLITDAPFHNGPPDLEPAPYRFTPAPHSYAETVAALTARGILVLGLGARDALTRSPMPHLRAIAEATGAVDDEGRPMAFDIGDDGGHLGDSIVDAIDALATDLPLDVTARIQDLPGDDGDALALITALTPASAEPAQGVAGKSATAFLGALPGTRLTFALEVDPAGLEPAAGARRFAARVTFLAADRSPIGAQDVHIVVTGDAGAGC